MQEKPTMGFRRGAFSQPPWQLINKSCLCNGAPIKTLKSKLRWNFPDWQYTMHMVSHWCWEGDTSWAQWNPSRPCSMHGFLWLTFHLYMFPIINCNHEYNSFPGVLWVFIANTKTESGVGNLWTCTRCQKWGWSYVDSPSNLVVGIRIFKQTWQPGGLCPQTFSLINSG